jgi:hypothetical protein
LIAGLVSHDLVVLEMQWRFARWVGRSLLVCIGIDLIVCSRSAVEAAYAGDGFGCSCLGATIKFNFYVIHGSNIPTIYGTPAGFIVLVLWIYAANLIL